MAKSQLFRIGDAAYRVTADRVAFQYKPGRTFCPYNTKGEPPHACLRGVALSALSLVRHHREAIVAAEQEAAEAIAAVMVLEAAEGEG